MTDLLTLASELAAKAKASNGTLYDACYELAHDYISPDIDNADEALAEVAYHLTNLSTVLLRNA